MELVEFGRAERQKKSLRSGSLRGMLGMLRRLDARPREPALRELVLAGEEPALGTLVSERIFAPAPDQLTPEKGGAVRRRSQRLPPQSGVEALRARRGPRRKSVRSQAIGGSDFGVRRSAQDPEDPV